MVYFLRFSRLVMYTTVLGTPACVTAFLDRGGEIMVRIARLWIRAILATCPVQVEAVGLGGIDPRQP